MNNVVFLCFLAGIAVAQPEHRHDEAEEVARDIFSILDKYGVITVRESAVTCPYLVAPMSQCPPPSILHYYTCCGPLNADCCQNVQGYVVLASVIFIVSSLICCLCCCCSCISCCCSPRRHNRYSQHY
ncbi:unnamed protein product [Bursaphelenchus xylophilus]|uniref:(pine wood nematode) hypothetical protein n=1 Tax=Bursaphelenchus xylophilus TaxID=6326 RepID=A0A1I7RJT2_BURXY|nr:unnamed protein product [Bursaphelenchus xylophilus]CAG9129051.1 unnamed protein product [Bursaphelenchus xylophilus]